MPIMSKLAGSAGGPGGPGGPFPGAGGPFPGAGGAGADAIAKFFFSLIPFHLITQQEIGKSNVPTTTQAARIPKF